MCSHSSQPPEKSDRASDLLRLLSSNNQCWIYVGAQVFFFLHYKCTLFHSYLSITLSLSVFVVLHPVTFCFAGADCWRSRKFLFPQSLLFTVYQIKCSSDIRTCVIARKVISFDFVCVHVRVRACFKSYCTSLLNQGFVSSYIFMLHYLFPPTPTSHLNQGSAVLVPLHIANECISMQMLKKKKKGREFEYFA